MADVAKVDDRLAAVVEATRIPTPEETDEVSRAMEAGKLLLEVGATTGVSETEGEVTTTGWALLVEMTIGVVSGVGVGVGVGVSWGSVLLVSW